MYPQVILAAELLKLADELVKSKVHPTSIISGYRLALKEAIKFMNEHMVLTLADVTAGSSERQVVMSVAATALSSKVVSSDLEFFSALVADAALAVRIQQSQSSASGSSAAGSPGSEAKQVPPKEIFPIKNIKILKGIGKSITDSFLVKDGFALNCSLAHQGMPKEAVKDVKIAFLDFSLQKVKMKLGVQILVQDPGEQLEPIRAQELEIAKQRAMRIVKSGAKVVLTTGGIDDLCAKVFTQAGIMGVRRVLKADLKRIARAAGGSILTSSTALDVGSDANLDATGDSFANTSEESIVKSLTAVLGTADQVVCERVSGDDELIIFRGLKKHASASIIVRGPNEYFVDEIERSVHDALCAAKRVLESKSLVPGAGAVEAALSVYLESYATSISSREQLAIAEFANSLLVIPRTLAVNGSKDAVDLVAKLRSYHHLAQTKPDQKALRFVGLDLLSETGPGVMDVVKAGILEPAVSKTKALRFATEAAITILRIDDLIKLENMSKGRGDECGGDD